VAELALVISILAGLAAIYSVWLQRKEAARRDEEIGLLRDEAKRRDEELDLLRRQLSAGEQAKLAVFAGVRADSSSRGIDYAVPVQNIGGAGASEIVVELVDGHGTAVGTTHSHLSLVAGEKVFVGVTTPPRERYTGPYEIYFEWTDGRGQQRAASGVQVGAPS
jgi:hypothetical protein